MPLLPGHPLPLLALAVAVVGTAVVVRANVHKAYGLAGVIAAVFALQTAGLLFLGPEASVAAWLGFATAPFLSGATWWTPFSYMYVHSDPYHIFGNLFILLAAGPTLEERIGSRAFLVIYFVAGLFAAASHAALAFIGYIGMGTLAVGASGAIFGVLTAFAVLYPRETLPLPIFFIIWLPAFVVLLIFLAFNVAYIFAPGSGTAWWGHFAGFLIGLVAATRLERQEAARPGAVEVSDLRPLATTEELQTVLKRLEAIEGNTPDDATWAEAWLERFAERAECPRCAGPVRLEGRKLVCEKGDWELPLRTREVEEEW